MRFGTWVTMMASHHHTGDLGFHEGQPVAALLLFHTLVHWGVFQAESSTLFDDIIHTFETQVGSTLTQPIPRHGVLWNA